MTPCRPSLVLLVVCAGLVQAQPPATDLGHWREMLFDRQAPRSQSQAALVLVQLTGTEAEGVVRQGLQQTEQVEVFLALANAVRLTQDGRFVNELLQALSVNRPGVRQAAAEALAVQVGVDLIARLQELSSDEKADAGARQAAIWALGRSGRKAAIPLLLAHLNGSSDGLRRAAADALSDLSGQNFGVESERWNQWWSRHREMSNEVWLESRLAFQTSRAHRLDGDLERARNQVLRLQQQFYNRLPTAERLAYIQSVMDQDDPAVRALAVLWAVEMLPAADAARQRSLTQVLLHLSNDGSTEVQRAAVLGLGRIEDAEAIERLQVLLIKGRPLVRAAAARSLSAQARSAGIEAGDRYKSVIPALQKALEDPALEVVVEAAEDLGALGAQEAGPVLIGLLRHPSEPVRQAAAQALERVADASVLAKLLDVLDDSSAAVRFSLVGALTRAASATPNMKDALRQRLLTKLEGMLVRDVDAGVRSRAATVLGECGTPAQLPALWRSVTAGEDGRVQEKAWAGFVEILSRSGSLAVLQEWDRTLNVGHQGTRRLQLLAEMANRWQKTPDRRMAAGSAQELLIQGQLDQGKWAAAFPQIREMLARATTDAEVQQRMRWLLTVAEQSLQEGNRAETLRAVQEAQPYMPRAPLLSAAFDKLEKQAQQKD